MAASPIAKYVAFAARYGIGPADAYVIPALFERTAIAVMRSAEDMVDEAMRNAPLGRYLADAAHKVAAADRAEQQAREAAERA